MGKSPRPDVTSVTATPCRECTMKENEYASMRLLSLYDQENHSNFNRDTIPRCPPVPAGQGFESPTMIRQYKPSETCAACSVADSGISTECCCHQYFDFDPEVVLALQDRGNTAQSNTNVPPIELVTKTGPGVSGSQSDKETMPHTKISKSIDSLNGTSTLRLNSTKCS